jgi:hypothetical protein
MRVTLIAILTLAVATVAFAGQNPQITGYISFDPAGSDSVNMVSPPINTIVNAYVCLGCIGDGMTTISFRMNNALATCPGVMVTQSFVNLMPGNLMIGDPFDSVGATIASTECMTMDPVIVGYATYFYLGGECVIELLDHADYPRWIVDCQEPGQVDFYCLGGNGGVGGAIPPDGEVCECDSPVEATTWGSIKSLYQ